MNSFNPLESKFSLKNTLAYMTNEKRLF